MSVRMGTIGMGTWGQVHAEGFRSHPLAELTAVCDANEDRAREAAEAFGAAKVYTNLDDLVADPDIDAVSVATPDIHHVGPVTAAIKAGKHVLVEKPLATCVADAERIAALAEEKGVTLMVDFHNRWNPPFVETKRAVADGEIGKPVSAYIRLHDTIFVPTQLLSWAAESSPLWFLGSHCLDLLCWILGDEVASVYAQAASGVLTEMGVNTPDAYTATLRFRNGAVAVMENCWVMPETQPIIIDFRFDLIASAGEINLDLSHNRTMQKYTREKAEYPLLGASADIHGRKQGFIYDSVKHFVDCIAENKPPLVSITDALTNVRILAAIEQSARTGEVVEM